VLRACRRVLKPGGTISFAVIAIADGLPEDEFDRAVEAGPPNVDAGPGYRDLLAAAGFEGIELTEASDEFLATSAAWVREWDAESLELERLVGIEDFAERQASRRQSIAATKEGLLRRHLISAVRPWTAPDRDPPSLLGQ
jgi:SAM-dependent methyltransferase